MKKKSILFILLTCFCVAAVAQTCGNFVTVGNTNSTFSLGIKTDGSLWTWGINTNGQLGDGTLTSRSSPQQAGGSATWQQVSGGYSHVLAIQTNGTLWCWGLNLYGQLGVGNNTDQLLPVQVGASANWKEITAGEMHSLGIKTDGTLWAWGDNSDGQLGDGTTIGRSSPVQIGTDNNWVKVEAGTHHSVGIKTDGTLWAWGDNSFGQLGDGSMSKKNAPVRIGLNSNWLEIACGDMHNVAIAADGTLWSWGSNVNGQLGDGTITQQSSPVQAGAANDWAFCAAGARHSIALKKDGTLWAFGGNAFGQLGDNTKTQRNSPVQINTESDWGKIAAGSYSTMGLKKDGRLFSWGYNYYGQIGDGSTVGRIAPKLITTDDAISLAAINTSQTLPVTTVTTFFNLAGCSSLIAKVAPAGGAPLNGNTNSKVWIENIQPSSFVKRHYEITPAIDATTATGRLTLYFTQGEFDSFNSVNGVKLPASPTDNTGIANLRVEKRPGMSNNGSGLPLSYTGSPVNIDPADSDIIWNPIAGRWEISFTTTGFSGFFVKTTSSILPLQWLSVSGSHNNQYKAQLNWKVGEQQVRSYKIEKSIDGRSFSGIAEIISRGAGINTYEYTDLSENAGVAYYRIKQTDLDGAVSYSSVIVLTFSNIGPIAIYPSPFTTEFTIIVNRALAVQLLTGQGQILKTLQLKRGTNVIPATGLASGVYLLKTNDGAVRKLLKR